MEKNIIHNLDAIQFMKQLPDESVNCIITDPPYGTIAQDWDKIVDFHELWTQFIRITTKQAPICVFGSEPFATKMRMAALDLFKYDWIWAKNSSAGFVHAKNMPLKKHEIIMVFSKGAMGHENLLGDNRMTYNPQYLKQQTTHYTNAKRNFQNCIGKRPSQKDEFTSEFTNYPSSILFFNKDKNSHHPTQKPLNLLRYLVQTYSNNNDTILDPFAGSGATPLAAILEHRNFLASELNTTYCTKANSIIKQQTSQLNIL